MQEQYVVGIDEAGRGPAIGPMVYGLAAIPISKLLLVKQFGANDSKQLTDQQRRQIFAKLKTESQFIFATVSVTAQQITEKMNQIHKISLNLLAFEAARQLLFEFKYPIQCAYIDLISPSEQYEAFIRQKLPKLKMVIEAKADANYPITGAASIVAKITRDDQIREDWGSGYPGDPETQKYLQSAIDKVYGFDKDNVRMSWSTTIKIMNEQCCKLQWQREHEDDKKAQQEVRPLGVLGVLGFRVTK